MKRKAPLLIFVIALGLVLCLNCSGILSPYLAAASQSDQYAMEAVVKANNLFAYDLYALIAKDKGNLFISPYSITSALAMTYAGARGATAEQMEQALHFDLAGPGLHPGFYGLMTQFNAAGKSCQLAVANALWAQQGIMFYPAFIETTREYYEAGFKEVNYAADPEHARQIINGWVEDKTNHKIIELLKSGTIDELTRLVLTNAIYFKGKWQQQFKPEQTSTAPFYVSADKTADVPLMYQTAEFMYAENKQIQLIELPYSGDDIVMDIVLPKSRNDFNALEADLNPGLVDSWLALLRLQQAEVYLPRFKTEKSLSLASYLQRLGMIDAFDENNADFSGMSDLFLYITHVIHKAFVEVNEEGTEAAAATAVVMNTKAAAFEETPIFRADHPFLFLIRHKGSGCILFMGRMVDPRQEVN